MKKLIYLLFLGFPILSLINCHANAAEIINQLINENIVNMQKAPDDRFNIDIKDITLQDFFNTLLKNSHTNMMVDPKIHQKISLHLNNVTLTQILDALNNLYGLNHQQTSYGYFIFPTHMETKIFSLSYLNIDRQGVSQTSINSSQLSQEKTKSDNAILSSNVSTETKNHFWDDLNKALNNMISNPSHEGEKNASVTINSQTGLISVYAYPENIQQIADYLESIEHIINREVMIDAKVLEVELNSDYQSGIDWKILGITQQGNQSLTDQIKNFASIFTLSGHWGNQFNILIKLMSTQGKVNVLSSPRISTINNQKAIIKIGSDRFFITGIQSNTDSSSGGLATSQNIDFTPFFSGVSLDVTPEINSQGDILLHIHPMISEVTEKNLNFTAAGQKESNIPLASTSIRESDNIVRAKSGQIVIIGGLMENSSQHSQANVPVLSNIPFIGALFRSTHNADKKTELIILLQPTIIDEKI